VYIHNFFLDISYSVSKLFDDYIFQSSDYIKHYEYNLGYAPLQFNRDLKPNFKLPAAIININNNPETIFSDRTESIQKLVRNTINDILVLYDKTKDLSLYLHEEYAEIPINVIINCESHLQCQEVAYQIRNFLPLNKYVMPVRFKSLLEIPEKYLNANNFDVINDEILNLYQNINYTSEYPETLTLYFAVSYQPAIKLNSVSIDISDSMQRTFQVNCDLSYSIQIPSFLYTDKNVTVERININYTFTKYTKIYAPVLFQQLYYNTSPPTVTYIRNLIIREEDLELTTTENNDSTIDFYIYLDKIYPSIALNTDYKYKFISDSYADYIDPTEVNTDENWVRFNFTSDFFDQQLSPVNNSFLLISIQL